MPQPLLRLLVETCVPDRGRGRRGERLAERDLVGDEDVRLAVPDRQDAHELVLEEEREAEERDEALALDPVEVFHARARENVAEGERRPVLHDPADQPLVVTAGELRALLRRARRSRLRVQEEVVRGVLLRSFDPHPL